MIQQAVHWLEKHWFINLLLVGGYICFLLFAHDIFVNISVQLMNHLSLAVYEKMVAAVLFIVGSGTVALAIRVVRVHKFEKRFVLFFGFTVLLLITHFFVLTEMNIEFIHVIMYGVLALLLFPLVGRFGGAVVLGLPVMLFDEWFQYIILFPDYTFLLEWNDVVLNLLGGGLFISALGLLGVRSQRSFKPLYKRVEVWLLASLTLIIPVLLATCVVVPYAVDSCAHTWLILNYMPEINEFWYVHPAIGSTLHVLKPIEGMVLVLILCIVYLGMDANVRVCRGTASAGI